MYCNTLACIAEKKAKTISQYSLVYCGKKAGSREDCISIQFTVL